MGGDGAVASFVREQVRERFLLYRSERIVRNRSADAQARVSQLSAAAQLRLNAARELDDPATLPASAPLYREAALLLITALRSARDVDFAATTMSQAESWQWLEAHRASLDARPPPADLHTAGAVLTDPNPLRLDRLDPDAAQREHEALVRALNWLQSSVEPRSITEIKVSRASRVLIAVGLLVALLIALAVSLFQPKNLAEGKPAQASSRFAGTGEASGVTNGQIESTYGVHTDKEASAWVSVDLRKQRSVRSVRVYCRADGWQSDVVPLVLELSKDGTAWQAVGTRDTPFTSSDPWVWKGDAVLARYVRVRRPAHGYIALTESGIL